MPLALCAGDALCLMDMLVDAASHHVHPNPSFTSVEFREGLHGPCWLRSGPSSEKLFMASLSQAGLSIALEAHCL